MTWITFGILSPAIFAVVYFLDKYLLEKRVPDYYGLLVISTIGGAVTGLGLWWFSGYDLLPPFEILILLLVGALGMISILPYLEALSRIETSTVIVLMQATPVMVLLLAWVFLREYMTLIQLIGFFTVLGVAVVAGCKSMNGKFSLSVGFWLVMLTNLMVAVTEVLFKFVSEDAPFVLLLTFESFGSVLGGVLLWIFVPRVRRAFGQLVKASNPLTTAVLITSEGLYFTARGVGYLAISLGPVAMVSVLGSTQILFGIAFGGLLAIIVPAIFGSEAKQGALWRKMALGGVMLVGLWLIQ